MKPNKPALSDCYSFCMMFGLPFHGICMTRLKTRRTQQSTFIPRITSTCMLHKLTWNKHSDSMQLRISLYPTMCSLCQTSDSIKLCQLQIANACIETKFHLSANDNSDEKRSQKQAWKTGSLHCIKIYKGHPFGTAFWAHFWDHVFGHLSSFRLDGV